MIKKNLLIIKLSKDMLKNNLKPSSSIDYNNIVV